MWISSDIVLFLFFLLPTQQADFYLLYTVFNWCESISEHKKEAQSHMFSFSFTPYILFITWIPKSSQRLCFNWPSSSGLCGEIHNGVCHLLWASTLHQHNCSCFWINELFTTRREAHAASCRNILSFVHAWKWSRIKFITDSGMWMHVTSPLLPQYKNVKG